MVSGRDVTAGDVVSVLGPVVEQDGEKAIAARYVALGKSRALPLTVGGGLTRLSGSLAPDGLLVRVPGTAGPPHRTVSPFWRITGRRLL